jgi:serine protease Do
MIARLSRGRSRALAFSIGSVALLGSGVVTAGLAQSRQTVKPGTPPSTAAIAALGETQNAFAAVAAQVTPAVVSIHVEGPRSPSTSRQIMPDFPQIPGFPDLREFGFPNAPRGDQPQGGQRGRGALPQQAPDQQPMMRGSGSGFIVSPDGLILTNNHVVENATKVTITLTDRREFDARVIGRDPTTDVAVIKVDGKDLPTLSFGDDQVTRVGDWVLAIGNPLGLDFTVTQGIVSAKGRGGFGALYDSPYAVVDYLQTDAPINPGNSGGPLVNIRGEVVGINAAIASPTGSYAGYGFAIPVTLAQDVMKDLVAYGHVRRGLLGLSLQEVRQKDAQNAQLVKAGVPQIRGALVAEFAQGIASPAKEAGVQKGDVIVGVNGQSVDHVASLQRAVRSSKPGDTVSLDLVRNGTRATVKVRLSEAPREDVKIAQK